MKSVVVTGASTGIGWGTVKILVERGFRVFGSVRNDNDAARLAAGFGPGFTPLKFDVTDPSAVGQAADTVAAALGAQTLFGLVNNAGIAVPGPLLHLPIDDFRHQMDVNLTGQLIVTQAFAPLLGADRSRTGGPGRIVMISSVAGRNATPFIGAYNASKFALEGLSEALRRELMLFGIDVIVIAPGPVVTPIWGKADAMDITPYAATPYATALLKAKDGIVAHGQSGLSAEHLGEAIHEALTARRPKVRYTVTPDPIRSLIVNGLPKRMLDRLIAARLGLRRKDDA